MQHTRDEADPRSPKRQAPTSSTTQAVTALDVGIWTVIIDFLPIPKVVKPSEHKIRFFHERLEYEEAVSDVATTWKTLLNLRSVSRELATLLHPVESKGLWRRLVLQSFDFSVGVSFNVANYQDEHGLEDPNEQDEDAEGDQNQQDGQEQNPQVVAMRGRYEDVPSHYLEEDLVRWSKLGIFHRPSQYGFLTTLQHQSPAGVWPESEYPFTLFGDLVRLLQLPDGEHMDTGGEDSDLPFQFLAAPAEAGLSSAFFRFYVMKTLGYVPHSWHDGRGIGDEWKGFTEPDALETRTDSNDDSDEFTFPGSNIEDAKSLRQHIRQHCRDWRSVCCNNGSDGTTPVFFVGESKASPHRWLGYAGEKCWL